MTDQPRTKIDDFIENAGAWAATGSMVLTIIAVAGAPIIGAVAGWLLAGSTALTAVGGAVVGLVAGFGIIGTVNALGKKKDPSYGTIEILCLPAPIVDTVVRKLLSPLKLLNSFGKAAAKKQPATEKASAPQPQNEPKA